MCPISKYSTHWFFKYLRIWGFIFRYRLWPCISLWKEDLCYFTCINQLQKIIFASKFWDRRVTFVYNIDNDYSLGIWCTFDYNYTVTSVIYHSGIYYCRSFLNHTRALGIDRHHSLFHSMRFDFFNQNCLKHKCGNKSYSKF